MAAGEDEEVAGAVDLARLDHAEQQRLVLVVVAAAVFADVDDEAVDRIVVDVFEQARGEGGDRFCLRVIGLAIDGVERLAVLEVVEAEGRIRAVQRRRLCRLARRARVHDVF